MWHVNRGNARGDLQDRAHHASLGAEGGAVDDGALVTGDEGYDGRNFFAAWRRPLILEVCDLPKGLCSCQACAGFHLRQSLPDRDAAEQRHFGHVRLRSKHSHERM
jgi:hypothetical protein